MIQRIWSQGLLCIFMENTVWFVTISVHCVLINWRHLAYLLHLSQLSFLYHKNFKFRSSIYCETLHTIVLVLVILLCNRTSEFLPPNICSSSPSLNLYLLCTHCPATGNYYLLGYLHEVSFPKLDTWIKSYGIYFIVYGHFI